MTNLKALLKFTHENITEGHWDMDADDYSEFMYLHEKAMGELGRLEVFLDYSECPPDNQCDHVESCLDCWRAYVDGGE